MQADDEGKERREERREEARRPGGWGRRRFDIVNDEKSEGGRVKGRRRRLSWWWWHLPTMPFGDTHDTSSRVDAVAIVGNGRCARGLVVPAKHTRSPDRKRDR